MNCYYKNLFYKMLGEDMNAAGDGGVFGSGSSMGHGGAFNNTDFYASGDARVRTGPGKKKGKKKKKDKFLIPLQRRPLTKSM